LACKSRQTAAPRRRRRRIDRLVYALYGLTYDEVKIIDPEFGLSAEEYHLEEKTAS
jgi:hypothetical protein